MRSRCISITVIVVLLLSLFYASAFADSENLLSNGGFELMNRDGTPASWKEKSYSVQSSATRFSMATDVVHSGNYAACIENVTKNDARYTCTLNVEPDSKYCMSGYIYVEYMQDEGNGANFALEEFECVSECVFNTDGWKEIRWYGKTGPNQTELTMSVRVGGYHNTSIGKAYFDDISLVQLDEFPEGAEPSDWFQETTSYSTELKVSKKNNALILIGYILLYMFFALALYWYCHKERTYAAVIAIAIFTVAFLARILLAIKVQGYTIDINCFTAWSTRIASCKPFDFYADDYFCDYPPLMILLLWPIGKLILAFGIYSKTTLLFVKLLPIIFDMTAAFLLYRLISGKHGSNKATFISCLYLLNPAVLITGSAWGQYDSILALVLTLAFFFAIEDRLEIAIPLYFAAVLLKSQALLAGPVLLVWLIVKLVNSYQDKVQFKHDFKKALLGIGIGLLLTAAVVTIFAIHKPNPIQWLFSLYGSTLSSYEYVTVNTTNLYYLFGCNWLSTTVQANTVLLIVTAVMIFAGTIILLIKRKRVKNAIPLSVLFEIMEVAQLVMLFVHASYAVYGYTWMAFLYLLVAIVMIGKKEKGYLFFAVAFIYIGLYLFGLKIHERYMFPALMLLLCSAVVSGDERLYLPFAGFGITTFVNTGIVLSNSILYGSEKGHLLADTVIISNILSVINILLFLYLLYLFVFGLKETKLWIPTEFEKTPEHVDKTLDSYRPGHHERLNLKLKDYLIIAIVTIAYGVFTLTTLGSNTAPQTHWEATNDNDQIILSLDEKQEFSLLYYCGVSNKDFSIAVSDDGENWSEDYPCQMNQFHCYIWKYVKIPTGVSDEGEIEYPTEAVDNTRWMDGKYIRLSVGDKNISLWEIVARDRDGNNVPLHLVKLIHGNMDHDGYNNGAENVVDEMDTCIGEPSWYNGTYFDEVYYSRTAYEILNGDAPYESTHPPLGKLLMAVCVKMLGLTPFAWRLAGATMGILMLPMIYLLAMQLTHKRRIAIISLLAMTLDLMHFAQTRLATIDSYLLLFIMLSCFFMIRYLQMDTMLYSDANNPKVWDKCFLKNMAVLLLCGIAAGLSIASKWTGCYSLCGLAVLFFVKQIFCLNRWSHAKKILQDEEITLDEEQKAHIQFISDYSIKRIIWTCVCCVLFFIIIPFAIYFISFIPRMKAYGSLSLRAFIRIQRSMFVYHSKAGLGMDHPFYSPWWQWPLILKPMWFAVDGYEPEGYNSTIMCLGNPWVFYVGAAAMLAMLVYVVIRIVKLNKRSLYSLEEKFSYFVPAVIALLFLAQYLPWVIVPRGTYIYHYFASVPFIIMATAYWIQLISEKNKKAGKWITVIYVIGTVLFFIAFLPYASGFLTPTKWLEAMKWFSKLYY